MKNMNDAARTIKTQEFADEVRAIFVAVSYPPTLAAYQGVRASSSVQVRTRTGRISPRPFLEHDGTVYD